MIERKIGGLKLKMYSSIEEMPIERYHKFNVYSLLSAGIGNDIESIQEHITAIFQALTKKDFDKLNIMFQNYYHSLHLTVEGYDTTSMAFTCLIHSINGKEMLDISEDNLRKVSKRITRHEKRQSVINFFRELKKKLKMK
jgi:hypothetical protein